MESEKSHVFSLLFGYCFGVSRWNTKKTLARATLVLRGGVSRGD